MDFADKWAAIVWMCRNQLGRRNITDEVKTVLIGEAYRAQRMSIGNHADKHRDENGKFTVSHQSGAIRESKTTEDIIAKQFGVGNGTVQRAKQFVDSVDVAKKYRPVFEILSLQGQLKLLKKLLEKSAMYRKKNGPISPMLFGVGGSGKRAGAFFCAPAQKNNEASLAMLYFHLWREKTIA